MAPRRGAPDRRPAADRARRNGRRAGDMVVLVRATSSLRLLEEALEEQGLPTYVVGGRGYWSQEQVRDGLAWLRVLANPQDEEALLTVLVLALPRRGHRRAGPARPDGRGRRSGTPLQATDARGRAAARGRARARPARAARSAARARDRRHRLRPRHARPPGRRPPPGQPAQADAARGRVRTRRGPRPARLPGRRAAARPRRGPRGRGRAGVRGPRRRAADDDPPREGARVPGRVRRRPRPQGGRLALAAARRPDGTAGLRLAPLGGGDTIPTPAWERLNAGRARSRRRGGAAPVLRRDDARQGAADPQRRHRRQQDGRRRAPAARRSTGSSPRSPAPAPGGRAADHAPAGTAARPGSSRGSARPTTTRSRRPRCKPRAPARPRQHGAPGEAGVRPAAAAAGPPGASSGSPTPSSPTTRSCGYRFYLRRVLGLPDIDPPPPEVEPETWSGIDPRTRGSIVHQPWRTSISATRAARAETVRGLTDVELSDAEVEEIRAFVAAFTDSPLRERLTAATRVTREAWFAFALEPDGSGPLVRGIVDVLATEPDGTHLVVDYKTDRVPRHDAGRLHRPQLRDAAARLRARRAARRRAAGRGRLLPARAPRRAGHRRSTPRTTRPSWRTRSRNWPAA